MTDSSPVGPATQSDEVPRTPRWTYVVLGLFALAVVVALLGVRTCL